MFNWKINKGFLFLPLLSLFLTIQLTYGDEIIHSGNEYRALGWISIGSGILANIPFLLYIKVKKISIKELGGVDQVTRDLVHEHKPILDYHMTLNLVGYIAGTIHGIFFIHRIDPISISLFIVMSILTFSGIVLRFLKSRNVMIFSRILHTQIIMSGLLVLLIISHIISKN